MKPVLYSFQITEKDAKIKKIRDPVTAMNRDVKIHNKIMSN
jgi:hypothetical protein